MKKIVIIGPESTGKSTLSAQLATHFNTRWCPEYAREYLMENGMAYNYDDLLTIAKGQVLLEEKVESEILATFNNQQNIINSPLTTHHSLLFIDTDQYVMKVWCEFVFNKCHHYILEQITQRKYDLYLLCNIDLPWIKDELREYPDEGPRKELYNIYKDLLINQKTKWVEISGAYKERLQQAVSAVEGLFI